MNKTMAIELAIIYNRKKEDRRYTFENRLQYEKQLKELVKEYNITYGDIWENAKEEEKNETFF